MNANTVYRVRVVPHLVEFRAAHPDKDALSSDPTLPCNVFRIHDRVPSRGDLVGEMYVMTEDPRLIYDTLGANVVLNVERVGVGHIFPKPEAKRCPFREFARHHADNVRDALGGPIDEMSPQAIALWIHESERAGEFVVFVKSQTWE